MALSASLVWEVRATGSATNSGGFRAGAGGTDYSQQDAPQATFADLAIDAADATLVSSAAVAFATDHVGNLIRITGGTGFTAGVYEVLSVASGVATLDRDCGTVGSTGGTGVLGGALDNPKPLESLAVSGNTAHVKAGTYSLGSQGLSLDQASITLIGYDQVRGDLDNDLDNPNRPWLQPAAGWKVETKGGDSVIANIRVAHASGSAHAGIGMTNRTNLVRNCQVQGPFVQTGIHLLQGYGTVEACEVTGDAPAAGIATSSNSTIRNCHVHDITTGDGVRVENGSIVTGNLITGIAGAGIQNKGAPTVPAGPLIRNTIHDCGGDGVRGLALRASTVIRGNLITACGGAGISNDSQIGFSPAWDGNAFWGNTSNHANLDGPSAFSPVLDVTLGADPYIDASGGDYRLNTAPSGGSACKGTAPGNAWLGSTSAGSLDMGAIQSAGSGSGGTGVTPEQVAAAVRADLTTELARIMILPTSSALTAEQTRAALGLEQADLDDQFGAILSAAGSVSGYATGLSPAEQVLADPANKLLTDANGRVEAMVAGVTDGVELTDVPTAAENATAVWGFVVDLEDDGGSTANDTTPLAALRRVWRRFFRPARKTATSLELQGNAGAVVSTQPITDDGQGNETQGAAS